MDSKTIWLWALIAIPVTIAIFVVVRAKPERRFDLIVDMIEGLVTFLFMALVQCLISLIFFGEADIFPIAPSRRSSKRDDDPPRQKFGVVDIKPKKPENQPSPAKKFIGKEHPAPPEKDR